MEYNSKFFIQTLAKGLDILEAFKTDKEELGITELSSLANMPESTVQRIVNTLAFKGYIYQNPLNKKYRLGFLLLKADYSTKNMNELVQKAYIHMKNLNEKTGENVNLAVRESNSLLYIKHVNSKHLLRPNFILGERYPLYCTALGRCLLSDFSEEELAILVNSPLEKYTPHTKTSFSDLTKDLKFIQENGYIIDDEEFQLGLFCIASPIYGFDKKVIAALSISLPKMRITAENKDDTIKWTQETAKKISADFKNIFQTN
ncbi:MAG: hypothetical protein VR72_18030 [Clostridiaceae bacterium BRH_c20a]|nr:MAG: hypothetical protein VR72_18030 [Clostridiaceae bacterium BRH_c20a]